MSTIKSNRKKNRKQQQVQLQQVAMPQPCVGIIYEPNDHDVLSGRGNNVNCHPGNRFFQSLVNQYKLSYIAAPKQEKSIYSDLIMNKIKTLDPPGRFLIKQQAYQKGGESYWVEIDTKKAATKTRQALRERAPEIKKEMTTLLLNNNKQGGDDGDDDDDGGSINHHHLLPTASIKKLKKLAATAGTSTVSTISKRILQRATKATASIRNNYRNKNTHNSNIVTPTNESKRATKVLTTTTTAAAATNTTSSLYPHPPYLLSPTTTTTATKEGEATPPTPRHLIPNYIQLDEEDHGNPSPTTATTATSTNTITSQDDPSLSSHPSSASVSASSQTKQKGNSSSSSSSSNNNNTTSDHHMATAEGTAAAAAAAGQIYRHQQQHNQHQKKATTTSVVKARLNDNDVVFWDGGQSLGYDIVYWYLPGNVRFRNILANEIIPVMTTTTTTTTTKTQKTTTTTTDDDDDDDDATTTTSAVSSSSLQKLAEQVVTKIHSLVPPGRFLIKGDNDGLWHEVGYGEAVERALNGLKEVSSSSS